MLKPNTLYLWQMVSRSDGGRSEPVTATLATFQEEMSLTPEEKQDQYYVLPLAELESDDPHQFVMRFPLMTIRSFLDYLVQSNTDIGVTS